MNRFLLTIFFLLVTNCIFSKDLVITGKIQNSANHSIALTFGPDPITGDKEIVNISLDDKGYFSLKYHTHAPNWVTFVFDQNYKTMGWFMTFPGDTIHISGDLKDLKATLKYSGSNRNYDKYSDLIFGGSKYISTLTFPDTSNIDWEQVNNNLDNITLKRLFRLDSILQKGLLSKIESNCLLSNIKYQQYSDLLYLSNKAYNRIDPKLFKKYFKYDMPNDSIALISRCFNDYVDNYIAIICGIENGTLNKRFNYDFNLFKGYYEKGLKQLNGLTRDVYLTRQINYCFKHGLNGIEDLYAKYQIDCKSQFLKEINQKEFELFKLASNKVEKLDYKIVTEPSANVTAFLKEFKGKVLLIEFWGSWCTPCIKAIPLVKKLETSINNKDFQIIHVAIKDTYENLDFAIKKYNLLGIHLLLNEKIAKEWKKTIDFYSVPYYALVDRDGKIVKKDVLAIEYEFQDIKKTIEKTLK
jgi:thiol-disulfide isomerase/thioredoxin